MGREGGGRGVGKEEEEGSERRGEERRGRDGGKGRREEGGRKSEMTERRKEAFKIYKPELHPRISIPDY